MITLLSSESLRDELSQAENQTGDLKKQLGELEEQCGKLEKTLRDVWAREDLTKNELKEVTAQFEDLELLKNAKEAE